MCSQDVVITVCCRRLCKKLPGQGAQIPRNEAYIFIRRNDEECGATQHMDFLRGR